MQAGLSSTDGGKRKAQMASSWPRQLQRGLSPHFTVCFATAVFHELTTVSKAAVMHIIIIYHPQRDVTIPNVPNISNIICTTHERKT